MPGGAEGEGADARHGERCGLEGAERENQEEGAAREDAGEVQGAQHPARTQEAAFRAEALLPQG
eukprot:4590125-Alexandrium_andersonii.AAC.1